MQELSLNILDIAQNSVKANASLIEVFVTKDFKKKVLTIEINDNGCGMTQETLSHVIDPFYTTRTTRKVGLGVPFFKMSATLTGGDFSIKSTVNVGTWIVATYFYEHIDFMPLGDMAATMMSLISVNPSIEFVYGYKCGSGDTWDEFTMDTREIKVILEGLPVNSPEVLTFISDFIKENQAEIEKQSKGWD